MKKSMSRFSICLLALVMVATIALPLSASAGDLSRTYSGQFTSNWSSAANSGDASITYGFNTQFIDEDFCWANHNTLSHFASLTNGSGVHNGPTKTAGVISKIEVTHNGDTVTYHCYW